MDVTSDMGQTSDWAEELRQQLEAAGESARTEDGESSESVSLQLSTHTLEMLATAVDDLLLGAPQSGGSAEQSPSSPLAEDIASAIDGSMAAWRSEIELSLAESATRQLDSQLQQVAQLSSSLDDREKELVRRESKLDEQSQRLNEELTASLRIQARTERQRKTLAAGLRRQQAEMRLELASDAARRNSTERQETEQLSATLTQLRAELERANAERDKLSEQAESLQQRESELSAEVATLNDTITTQQATAGNSEELELKLRQLEEDNAQLEEKLGNQREQLEEEMDAENARLLQMISNLNATIEQLEKQVAASDDVTEQLLRAESEIEQLRTARDSDSASTDDEAASEALEQSNAKIEQLEQELAEREEQISQLSAVATDVDADADNGLAELRQQLADYQEKVEQLEQENERLAAAEHSMPPGGNSPHVNFNQESLSWEERKKLIMDQLEHDDDAPLSPEEQATTLEIESILQSTQTEIERRDRDIEELRSIIEQQSDTKQGVAIGAAAIAQMFDDDELVVQEREKLKELQGEWEDKVRQAEIDISMERAKLARQRSEVESKVAELEAQLAKHGGTLPPANEEATGGRTRKWLEHLGLKDDAP